MSKLTEFLESNERDFSAEYFNELHKSMVSEAVDMQNEKGLGAHPFNVGLWMEWIYSVSKSHATKDVLSGKMDALISENK